MLVFLVWSIHDARSEKHEVYRCLIQRHVLTFQVIIGSSYTLCHKREIQKCFAFWKLRSQFLRTNIHVYIIIIVKMVVKNSYK